MSRWPSWKQKRALWRRVGYAPHELQTPIHKSGARIIAVSGGERAGKSQFTGMELFACVPWCERIVIASDEYDEGRKEFSYLTDALVKIGALGHTSTPRRGAWYAYSLTGCEIRTLSLHDGVNELTATGEPYDIVALVEWGYIGWNAFLAARGRVAETRGRVLMSGTLQDSVGWQADMWHMGQRVNEWDVASFALPSYANRALFPGGLEDPEIASWRQTLSREEAARRIDGELISNPARVYPQFSHVAHVQPWAVFDGNDDVTLLVDAGYHPSRYAVLAAQFRKDGHGREMMVIVDELWEHNRIHEEIVEMCKQRPWADNVARAIGGHETRQHQAARSTAEVWSALWPGLAFETFDAGSVLEGVRRVQWLLEPPDGRGPRLAFGPGCEGLAWEFQHYKRPTDRVGTVTSEQPLDAYNDALDALRVGVMWRFGLVDTAPQKQRVWQSPFEQAKLTGPRWGVGR